MGGGNKKHAARTPVAEGWKKGESDAGRGRGKVVRTVCIPCGRCVQKSKKHAVRTPVGEGRREAGGPGGEGWMDRSVTLRGKFGNDREKKLWK